MQTATQILRAGNSAKSSRYASPVMGVWGKAVIGERSSPLRRPPASFGFFSTWKRNSPNRAKPYKTARRVVAPYKSKETTLAARRRRNTSAENPPSVPMRASGPTGGKTTGAAEAGPRPAKKRPGQKNLRMHRRGGGNIPTPLFTRLFDLCPFAVSPSDDGSLSQTQWVRRTRPLARRRASTLRPFDVRMRLRKPCSLER